MFRSGVKPLRNWIGEAPCAAAALVAAAVALFPLYWAVVVSLRPRNAEIGELWLPGVTYQPTLAAWRRLLTIPELGAAAVNSVIVSVGAATLAVVLAAPLAYAIGRLQFPRRWASSLLLAMFLLRLLPPVVYLPSYLLLFRQLGLIDTHASLILVNATINLPLAAIVLAGAFREIPRELEEAAWIDGAGRWRSFARVCLPLVAPALVAAWLLCLAFVWNEWMYASALGYIDARTLPVLIQATGAAGGANMGAATTRALTSTVVPIIAALLVQRYMVRALSLGAVKG